MNAEAGSLRWQYEFCCLQEGSIPFPFFLIDYALYWYMFKYSCTFVS